MNRRHPPRLGSLGLAGLIWLAAALILPNPAGAPLLDGEPLDFAAPTPAALPAAPLEYQDTAALLQEYLLSLPCDPKAGLGWRLAAYDREYLELQTRRFQKAASPAGQPQEIFVFLPRKTGQTRVTLHYQRPFDRQPTAVRVYQITIR